MAINRDLAQLQIKRNWTQSKQVKTTTEEQKQFNQKLKKASDGFEEVFVHKLLQVMRSSTEKSGLLSGGRGEEIFRDMLDQNYSKIITKSGALGLSKVIYENAKEK
ncbi:MAG: hypothetical protein COB67_03275 [SAR324 cluster bacterium]|uniref:Flagellar protein FlgJ N-terminal domain-containing protein n=1 Tax=SAR324 cluster bacterium TaxID=2024889 RepID=A0A2A4T806_9DELT|nr:MAG: hypothetical protein COB67_03275 [SAR324 cluster bacterium]